MKVTAVEGRRSPLAAQVALFVAFLVIAVVSIFTVLVPELSDDAGEGEAETEESAPVEPAE